MTPEMLMSEGRRLARPTEVARRFQIRTLPDKLFTDAEQTT